MRDEKRKSKKIGLINKIIIIAILILIALALYLAFTSEECVNFECFQRNMVQCSKASYINEEPEATWLYDIKGKSNRECEIEVTLLLAKEGELGLDNLEGFSMSCFYPVGVSAYPDKDLSVCHGRLKEEFQTLIIEKLHGYVLSNLEEIRGELGRA